MDVKAYRQQYESELNARAAAAPRSPVASSTGMGAVAPGEVTDRIPALLQTLDDAAAPTQERVAALFTLGAASFLGARFAVHRAAFLAVLRKLATKDTDPALRVPAIETLARANDASVQQVLKDGLVDAGKALVDPIKALQLLSEDDHSDVSVIATDLFHKTDDLGLKEAALRAMSSNPASQDLFATLVADKSAPKSLRALGATGLSFLNPERFGDVARGVVLDDGDFPDIRATVLGALANGHLHQRLQSDTGFLDRVLKLGAGDIDALRHSALRFLGRP